MHKYMMHKYMYTSPLLPSLHHDSGTIPHLSTPTTSFFSGNTAFILAPFTLIHWHRNAMEGVDRGHIIPLRVGRRVK